jgi:hypothetical protein
MLHFVDGPQLMVPVFLCILGPVSTEIGGSVYVVRISFIYGSGVLVIQHL